MKKFFCAALAAALFLGCFAFAGCGAPKKTAQVIEIALTSEEYAFGVDKNQPELLARTNEFIKKIMSDGTFDDICGHYFGGGTPAAVTSCAKDAGKDQLVVATNAEFEPFEYMKGTGFYGIDMEIAALLAKELGLELVIEHMNFDAVCLAVAQGQCDIAMAGLTVSDDRREHVDFTDSYYNASQMIMVPEGSGLFAGCASAEDIEKKLKGFGSGTRAGAQGGTTGQYYLEGDPSLGFEGFAVTCVPYTNGALAVQDMLNGNLDFVVIDEAPAHAIAGAFGGK